MNTKQSFIHLLTVLLLSCATTLMSVAQVSPPSGWGDFAVGLVNDNSNIYNVRMKQAMKEGVKLHYRYAYINSGVDPASNAISWLFSPWSDYAKNSADMGLRPGFVIYMLQEEGGAAALRANIQNAAFMKNYFKSIQIVAQKSNGYKAIFVIEPDTWGYFLQDALENNRQSDPRLVPATVNNLGAGYEYLADLPNTLSGVAQGIIRTIRRNAPDAYAGTLMSFWSVNANGVTGPPVSNGQKGMVYWNQGDVDYSAKRNADFANQLLGTADKGNFIGVEKNGWSAGHWLAAERRDDYYWNDVQNGKWVSWSKTLSQNTGLPLLGWQISISHTGLPNTIHRYEDTFMPYFFTHVQDFINAGFIGFLVGKGTADDTDYTNLKGNELESDGSAGDDGWFFEQLKKFDIARPYLNRASNVLPNINITSPANNTAYSAGSSVTITANATDSDGTISKVEFFQGTVKLGEDLSSPYSYTWSNPAAGSYTLTAKATDNAGGSTTSAPISITVSGTVNNSPTVNITAPATGAAFTAPASVTISANATDDGSVAKVEFFNGSTKLGEDLTAPYSYSWTNVAAGSYTLTAKATDNQGASTVSAGVNITVTSANNAPSVNITAPATGAAFTAPASVTINANATDDGSVAKVEFFNGSTKLGEDLTAPYSYSWTNVAAGSYTLTAKATDNLAASTVSAGVNITVNSANNAPSVNITAPATGAAFTAPASVTINANATDDGSVAKVEFFNGSTKLGEDLTAPYSYSWTNVAAGSYTLTAKATDNQGASTVSAGVSMTVNGTTGGCTGVAQYVENGGYIAGSKVQNNGSLYTCKPYPYSGWCNGAAWAYAPGTGAYWTDAWDKTGSCTAKSGVIMPGSLPEKTIELYPNPANQSSYLKWNTDEFNEGELSLLNGLGIEVYRAKLLPNTQTEINMEGMDCGIYFLQISAGNNTYTEKLIKQ